jgi:hypothetical protein
VRHPNADAEIANLEAQRVGEMLVPAFVMSVGLGVRLRVTCENAGTRRVPPGRFNAQNATPRWSNKSFWEGLGRSRR